MHNKQTVISSPTGLRDFHVSIIRMDTRPFYFISKKLFLFMVITGRNEVVAKVMFLHVCVILFTGGGSLGRVTFAPRTLPNLSYFWFERQWIAVGLFLGSYLDYPAVDERVRVPHAAVVSPLPDHSISVLYVTLA